MQRFATMLAFAAALVVHHHARADEASGASETLFLEGKKLMQEGRIEEACEKFKASHDGDKSATGTLLNLALCNEQRGHTASAWGEFRQVASESDGKRMDRYTLAREHEAKLYPLLSYAVIKVRADARVTGLRIVLDNDKPLSDAMLETQLAIDPGEHTVLVEAPDRLPQTLKLTVGGPGAPATLEVLPLELAPDTPKSGSSGRRTAGYAVGAVGLAALTTGVVFGIFALTKDNDVKSECPNYSCPSNKNNTALDSEKKLANTFALVTDISVGVGAALVITGAALIYTGRDKSTSRTGFNLRAAPGTHGGSMLLEGSF
jgi:hypothetical protein